MAKVELPFADGFFDALVSLEAYHSFGTDDLNLGYYARFVKPGGQIGIVVPGLQREFGTRLLPHLETCWPPDFWSFHSPDWRRDHWARTGRVTDMAADMVPGGWEHWLRWLEVAAAFWFRSNPREAARLRLDAGRSLGCTRLVARKA